MVKREEQGKPSGVGRPEAQETGKQGSEPGQWWATGPGTFHVEGQQWGAAGTWREERRPREEAPRTKQRQAIFHSMKLRHIIRTLRREGQETEESFKKNPHRRTSRGGRHPRQRARTACPRDP